MSSTDVIVIGAGHNGLACAIRLAKQGAKVLVVDQRAEAGGLCAPRTLEGGYTVPGVLHDTAEIRSGLCDSLGLFAHGLELNESPTPLFSPEQNGEGVVLHADPAKSAAALAGRSEKDAESYRAYRAFLGRIAPVLSDTLNRLPPSLAPSGAGDLMDLGLRGLALRRLGKADMTELMRIVPMAVADWMREQFETEVISAAIAGAVMPGNWVGPWSPGTVANLILGEACRGPEVKGGPAALVKAQVKALAAAGGELRLNTEVEQILIDEGRVTGVRLVDGATLEASIVASAASPRRTLLELLGPGTLPLASEIEATNIRGRGMHAKVHLGLSGPIPWKGRDGEVFEHVRVGEHLDDLERAFDASKYRRFAESPALDIRVPTASTPEYAPDGHHVASIIVSTAPYTLEIGWSQETREALLDAVLETLEKVAPGTSSLVKTSEVLAPPDLETEYGLPGGNLLHVEHALDQLLFMRPSLGLARYQAPVDGLWLCGAGSHPGGGVTLAPGALAAQAILKGEQQTLRG